MSENVASADVSGAKPKAKMPKGMIIILLSSLILIIGAVITLLVNYFSWGLLHGMMGAQFEGIVAVDIIAVIVSAIVDIIGGTLGVFFCAKPARSSVITISGVIMMIFALYGILIDAVNDASLSPISVAISILLPIVYLIGGILNKRSAKG